MAVQRPTRAPVPAAAPSDAMTAGPEHPAASADERLRELTELVTRPSIRAVSTDVFDTLVWRAVPSPDEAFVLLGERLARRELLSPRLTVRRVRDAALRRRARGTRTARDPPRRHRGHARGDLRVRAGVDLRRRRSPARRRGGASRSSATSSSAIPTWRRCSRGHASTARRSSPSRTPICRRRSCGRCSLTQGRRRLSSTGSTRRASTGPRRSTVCSRSWSTTSASRRASCCISGTTRRRTSSRARSSGSRRAGSAVSPIPIRR